MSCARTCSRLINYNFFFCVFNIIAAFAVIIVHATSTTARPYVITTYMISGGNSTETLNSTATYAIASFSQFNFWMVGLFYFLVSAMGSAILAFFSSSLVYHICSCCEGDDPNMVHASGKRGDQLNSLMKGNASSFLGVSRTYNKNADLKGQFRVYNTLVKAEFAVASGFITFLVARSNGIVDISALLMISVIGTLFGFFSVASALLPSSKSVATKTTPVPMGGDSAGEPMVAKGNQSPQEEYTVAARAFLYVASLLLSMLMIFVFYIAATFVKINYFTYCALWMYAVMMFAHLLFEFISLVVYSCSSSSERIKENKDVHLDYQLWGTFVYVLAMYIFRTAIVGLIMGAAA